MIFKRKYDKHDRIYTNHGKSVVTQYSGYLDKFGNTVVKEKGKKDLYSYIQSFADSVDINLILSKFANGDKQALIQRAATYIDITNMPDNMADLLNTIHNGEALFDSLPVEVKQKFDNNFNKFITTIDSDEWFNAMNVSEEQLRQEKIKNAAIQTGKLKEKNIVYGDQIKEVVDEIPVEAPSVEVNKEVQSLARKAVSK